MWVVVTLIASAIGSPALVRADLPPDPAARLQFIVHKIHIINDEDLIGGGEEKFFVTLCGDSGTSPYNRSFACGLGASSAWDYAYDLSSGDDVSPERLSPREGDFMEAGASPEAGIPVYAGQHYILTSDMFDRDPAYAYDTMGDIFVHVDEEHNWSLGTHTVRSIQDNGQPGDYELTFEIRQAPLPDLVVNSVYVQDPTGTPFVCGDIRNLGAQPAPPAELTLSTEGNVIEHFRLPALDVGWSYPHCVKRSDLPAKKHNLVFSIDDLRELPEMNELNNVGVLTVEAIAPTVDAGSTSAPQPTDADAGTPPSPRPKPGATQAQPSDAQPDLVVRSIRASGQNLSGKTGCTTDVSVVVRNDGQANAESFVLRLSVDGDTSQAVDKDVKGLAAGQEREVLFDGVRLKPGQRVVGATADASNTVAEANEDNNDAKTSVMCKAGS